jgi:hypothetical protein
MAVTIKWIGMPIRTCTRPISARVPSYAVSNGRWNISCAQPASDRFSRSTEASSTKSRAAVGSSRAA